MDNNIIQNNKLSKVAEDNNDDGSPVVASLSKTSPHPFSSLALSPKRKYAVLSGKDVIQLIKVDPQGIKSLRTLKIAQHFQAPVNPPSRRSQVGGRKYGDVRDTFALSVGEQQQRSSRGPRPGGGMIHGNVVVTCVAWSNLTTQHNKGGVEGSSGVGGTGGGAGGHHEMAGDSTASSSNKDNNIDKTTESLIAAAGSNGIVAIWNAKQLLFGADGTGGSSTTTLTDQQPEAILSQHTRAVNSLAWHPRLPGLLLTASQDSTIKLWERMEVQQSKPDQDSKNKSRPSFRFFGKLTRMQNLKSYTWSCRSTFEPKSEAVRDVQWSKFQDDIFAVVTVSGSLVVYSMHVAMRALVKVAAHTGDATTLDWHPTRPFVLATGGSGDRSVKVWDLEKCINMSEKDDTTPSSSILNNNNNNNTWNTARSEFSSGGNSFSSSETDKSSGLSGPHAANLSIHGARALSGNLQGSTLRIKSSAAAILHVLSISSSVTKLKWRPPANLCIPSSGDGDDNDEIDRHDSMLAVASARLTSAGGSGALSLWSFNRPFMALSVVEGHKEGAVADFVWLETPQPSLRSRRGSRVSPSESSLSTSRHEPRRIIKKQMASSQEDTILIRSSGRNEVESILFDNKDNRDGDDDRGLLSSSIWQHILSVGRDGQCLLQSFVRGERPIYRVPPSCFAMANLSPFQSGYGSLQCFSVYQNVPRMDQDYQLSGLRQDEITAIAPGVFREIPPQEIDTSNIPCEDSWISGRRLPATPPDMIFNVIDQGNLEKNGLPLENDDGAMCIAPEVVHLSRFADMYKLYPDERVPTRVGLCLHNGEVAAKLRCSPLCRMWMSIASMLAGAGMDELHSRKPSIHTKNVMQFAIYPTIKSLLEERATSGDVQTCVAVCEVLQVIQSDGEQTIIPGLALNLVREWYLSYIDLLQQMCLFSAASSLIRSCKDPFIGALNQQSTTFHESCPRCGKPLPNEGTASLTSARRVCMNCRHPVGLCFVCHQPVKGMFVWCPGCAHGGHLVCALQWFGGTNGTPVREVCPTGCGHRCNFTQTLSAFPRTDSMTCLPVTDVGEMIPR